jgi:hypothetical protein
MRVRGRCTRGVSATLRYQRTNPQPQPQSTGPGRGIAGGAGVAPGGSSVCVAMPLSEAASSSATSAVDRSWLAMCVDDGGAAWAACEASSQ